MVALSHSRVTLHITLHLSLYLYMRPFFHQDVPDIFQGYGRVNLAKVLPLQGHSTNSYTLFVDQNELKPLTELVYTVVVKSAAEDLKITLSWYDPPTAEFAARNLVHDLDLIVINPASTSYYGNSVVVDTGYTGSRDELNNVRRLTNFLPHQLLLLHLISSFLSSLLPLSVPRVTTISCTEVQLIKSCRLSYIHLQIHKISKLIK